MNVISAHSALAAAGRHLCGSLVLLPVCACEGSNCSLLTVQMALHVNMASSTYVSKL